MTCPSDRALCKRKWAVNKSDGPLALFAEHLEKKLRKHFYPCRWEYIDDKRVVFLPEKGFPPLGAEFSNFLRLCIRNLNVDLRVNGSSHFGNFVYLDGPHFINERGQLKKVKK